MNRNLVLLTMLATLLGFGDPLAAQATSAANIPLGPESGIVLLANGQVLAGQVTRAGDYYYVVVDNGEIRLRRQEVELVCRNLEEGYQLKKNAIPRGELVLHLDLADWCVRHQLFDYAAEQIACARALQPQHLRIGLVERRLQLERERKVGEPSTPSSVSNGPSHEELDRMIRVLPPGVIDQFANLVQPMLLNNCTATGCHGPSSTTGYSLMKIPLGRSASRRLTQRNLYATLERINRAKPQESPLVVAALRPHGGSKTPIFSGRDLVQYQHLVAWVQRLAEGNKPVAAPNLNGNPTANAEPRSADVLLQSSPAPTTPPLATTSPNDSKQPSFENRDPFDPQVFNRRYHGEESTKP